MVDYGDVILASMIRHQACWHKACSLKVNQTKLVRLNEKLVQSLQTIQTCSTHETVVDLKDAICMFYDQPAGDEGLCIASTYEIDRTVRQYAIDLQNTVLLAKLATGDMITLAKYHKLLNSIL